MDIDNLVKEIQQKGFCILKKYKTQNFCDETIKQINVMNYPSQRGEGGDIRVVRYENYSKNANQFLNDELFLLVGTKLINRKVDGKTKRCQLGIVEYNENKNKNSGGGWHVDNHKQQFKAMLYLTDVNENNGPFSILYPNLKSTDYPPDPTRHNMRFPDQIAIDHKDKIQILTGNAGDVTLFLSHNIHRGTDIKEGLRLTLTNYYYDGIYTK